ncbi:alpha/beta hydrolase family protein [Rhodococcus sp. IEGM 1408]|uniref:alpha/beta hydrolase n=1 Tax=Rhodococcus sp. IEGM 1408 TaxID=3082220 RepID=UPI002955639E|nr:alpha/beta hydrolase family protein [Rhodococcus sp. IEGM 1408]MDV7999933.1 alpha/beta hydrolase family protein [Rhodococcus sp. IEGM 1408]
MSSRFPRFAATAGALAVALTLGAAAPASAQLAGLDPASLGPEGFDTLLSTAGSVPLGSTLGSVGTVGSSDFPLTGSMSPIGTPRPVDESITESKFVEKVAHGTNADYEYWLVHSKAMKREVIVEVKPSKITDEGAAPVLYMLDGVDAPEFNSGWNHQGHLDQRLALENVHVVVPTGAFAAYYTDWNEADPRLGYNKWETFLTQELPGIVTEQLSTAKGYVGTNGRNAIGGISMGGQAAMHLAATYPTLYQGVMSFSGYYSTMDELGYQTIRGTIETRGGNLENMWGPRGSDKWKRHDTISHPEGLENTAVYMSSGAPMVDDNDRANYGTQPGWELNMFLGLLLESGVLEGTRAFERALDRAGVEDVKVDYAESGLHNWPNFLKNFESGWNHIMPALHGDDVEPGTGTPGSGSAGSSGSIGS